MGTAPSEHTDVLPAWRWPLYLLAVLLGPALITIVGLVMWRGERYTRVGRNVFLLSWVWLLLLVVAAVALA